MDKLSQLDWKKIVGFTNNNKLITNDQVIALVLGQFMSFMITGTGITSQLLASKWGVNAPTLQSSLNYFLLALVYGAILIKQGRLKDTLFSSPKKVLIYIAISLVDLEANYLVVKAYQYTTFTSIMLLDCFTIPCAVVLTFVFLKTKYNLRHILGVFFCIGGLSVLIYSDFTSLSGGSDKLLGDVLCIIGSFLYAVSNVATEAFMVKFDRIEYLSMLGLFAFVFSAIQFLILERHEVTTLNWSWNIVSLVVAYNSCLFLLYSVIPITIFLGGAALFNLSLLTSDIYAIIVSLLVFKLPLSLYYYISYIIIVFGLLFYNIKNEPTSTRREFRKLEEENQDLNSQDQNSQDQMSKEEETKV